MGAELTHEDGRTDINKRSYNISVASWSGIEHWTSRKKRAYRRVSTLVMPVGRLLFAVERDECTAVLMLDEDTRIYSRYLQRTINRILHHKLISCGSKSHWLPPDLLINCLLCYSVSFSHIITRFNSSFLMLLARKNYYSPDGWKFRGTIENRWMYVRMNRFIVNIL